MKEIYATLDIGSTTFDLITNNPKKIIGYEGDGLKIHDIVHIKSEVTEYNKKYLNTKREKMHHAL